MIVVHGYGFYFGFLGGGGGFTYLGIVESLDFLAGACFVDRLAFFICIKY